MGRGIRKKIRSSPFVKGHECFYKKKPSLSPPKRQRIIRQDRKTVKKCGVRLVNHVITPKGGRKRSKRKNPYPVQNGLLTDNWMLRPSPASTFYEQYRTKGKDSSQYILVHQDMNSHFWNQVMAEHVAQKPKCKGHLNYDTASEQPRGLVNIMSVKCDKCNYKSQPYKQYEELSTGSRGRKSAVPNVRMQISSSKQGIGNEGLQHILTSLNMRAPSLNGMQHQANKINPKLVDINQKDMFEVRNMIRKINILVGDPENVLDGEADGTYNNRSGYMSGQTPTQPATQCTYLFIENNTDAKKIIDCKTYSRLCICDVRDRCGPHREGCGANLPTSAVIGNEKRYLAEALSTLHNEEWSVEFLTCDGDVSVRNLVDGLQQPDASVELKVLYCHRHLTRGFIKAVIRENFTAGMFPGKKKEDRVLAQKLFAHDISKRIQAEFNIIWLTFGADVEEMVSRMNKLYDVLVECYSGNCNLCKEHSFACSELNPWHRTYLNTCDTIKAVSNVINPTDTDRDKLRHLLDMRLSRKSVVMTQNNTTQNKAEASNRGVNKAVPKHITFSRNHAGRVHSAVHSMNNNAGQSTIMLAESLGVPYPPQSPAVSSFEKMDKRREYQKARKQSQPYRTTRAANREKNFKESINRITAPESSYLKNVALYEDLLPARNTVQMEHSYNTVKPVRRILRPRKS